MGELPTAPPATIFASFCLFFLCLCIEGRGLFLPVSDGHVWRLSGSLGVCCRYHRAAVTALGGGGGILPCLFTSRYAYVNCDINENKPKVYQQQRTTSTVPDCPQQI